VAFGDIGDVRLMHTLQMAERSAVVVTVVRYEVSHALTPISQDFLKDFSQYASVLVTPGPDNLKEWQSLNQQITPMFSEMSRPIVDLYQPNFSAIDLGGVKVLDIKPRDWLNDGNVLVFVHGGGFTSLSANSTLGFTVPVANKTGLHVISVDYTLAPTSKWNQTTDEILSVVQALVKDQGYSMSDIAIYGDSAGGNLVAGSVLKMRDTGMGLPSAIVLWSPWVDLTGKGDSYVTLEGDDPFSSYNATLKNMAGAYATPSEQENPYVSPVYGNFTKGFPPTLLQVGTKEILLSDSVRLYQALEQADIPVKLDIYEGMPHVFQGYMFNTPESNLALNKMSNFLNEYLRN
jgi:acetyl esterase/lipase